MNSIVLQNKAQILRKAADRIEKSSFDWDSYDTCVIGNIGKASMPREIFYQGLTAIKHYRSNSAPHSDHSWTGFVDFSGVCPSTGLSMNAVIAELQKVGFSPADILRAEFGDREEHESFLKHTFETDDSYYPESKESIVLRLREWAFEIDSLVLQSLTPKATETVSQSIQF